MNFYTSSISCEYVSFPSSWSLSVSWCSMSLLPFYLSWVFMFGLVGFFTWNLLMVFVCLLMLIPGVIYLFGEVSGLYVRCLSAFWLFIFSEAGLFVCFIVSGLWFEGDGVVPVSSFNELPLLGCTFLIGSSFYATSFHYHIGELYYGGVYLMCAIALGAVFICVQFYEYFSTVSSMVNSPYDASALLTVSLHFFHVFLGLVILSVVYVFYSLTESWYWFYYMEIGVWYWHFVDYIWLVVCLSYYW